MKYFLIIIGLVLFIQALYNPVDVTDKDFWHRSNMALHIDNETGCHYLSGWSGVLTPRLDKALQFVAVIKEQTNENGR